MSDDLQLTFSDSIATITINRPAMRNAMNYEMWRELPSLCQEIERHLSARSVIITGAGEKAFSAGADINDFERYRKDAEGARDWAHVMERALTSLQNLSRPVIAKVKGYCVGGGCELVCFADIRIASETGRFGIPAACLGIALGHMETKRLTDLLGVGNTAYLLLTGRQVTAEEAFRMGLVNQVVPSAEIDRYVATLAQEIAQLAPLAHRYNKEILRTVSAKPDVGTLSATEAAQAFKIFESHDYQEGRTAFLEKRQPKFNGS